MIDLVLAFALLAVVLIASAVGSPFVERAPLSFPMLFLGLGVLLGPHALGLISIGPRSGVLETIAVISLSFVLFLDAINLKVDELGKHWAVPILTLGPGTVLVILCIAVAAFLLLHTGWIESLLLGAVLASTDPVVTRDVTRDSRIPAAVRGTLEIEAGMNDVIVLPIVLILIAIAQSESTGAGGWVLFLVQLLVVGPLAGAVVGGSGSWLIGQVEKRYGVRREYQALYGVGLVLASYAAGDLVGGDGFLAAFAAGLTVSLLNYDLCDCFLEYGETTAEMAMLLAFILFGVVLSSITGLVPLLPAIALGVVAIFVVRPLAIALVLRHANVSRVARGFIGWFGPRGLSSLLFALLIVEADVPNAVRILAAVGVVVGLSVTVHGVSATPLAKWYGRMVAKKTLAEERESATGLFEEFSDDAPRITPEQLMEELSGPAPPIVLDVRTRSSYSRDGEQIPDSVRVLPDEVREWAADQDKQRRVVAYCT